jgi:hypothetical protein
LLPLLVRLGLYVASRTFSRRRFSDFRGWSGDEI